MILRNIVNYLSNYTAQRLRKNKKLNQSHYRPEVPRGFQEVTAPTLRDNDPEWWQGCQPYAPAVLPPRNTPGTHFC